MVPFTKEERMARFWAQDLKKTAPGKWTWQCPECGETYTKKPKGRSYVQFDYMQHRAKKHPAPAAPTRSHHDPNAKHRETADPARGLGHVVKEWQDDADLWHVRLHVFLDQDPITGKQKTTRVVGDGETKAAALENARIEAGKKRKEFRDTGVVPKLCRDSLAAFGRKWLANHQDKVKRSTWRNYSNTFRAYIEQPPDGMPPIGRVPMKEVHAEQVRQLYTYLRQTVGLARSSVRGLHAVLKQIFATAYRDEAITKNLPAQLEGAVPKERRGQKEAKALTKDQLAKFLAAADLDRYRALWNLLAGTGMRPGEALGLLYADLDFEKATARINKTLDRVRGEVRWELTDPKTKTSNRTIKLPKALLPILQEHLTRQGGERNLYEETRRTTEPAWPIEPAFVFRTQTGQPCDWTTVTQNFRRVMRRAGLGTFGKAPEKKAGQHGPAKQPRFTSLLSPYCLRHTHATLALESGVPVKVVSERLGHASTAFTMDVYTDALPHMQERAAEAWDDLLEAFKK
jgi:integrase